MLDVDNQFSFRKKEMMVYPKRVIVSPRFCIICVVSINVGDNAYSFYTSQIFIFPQPKKKTKGG